MILIGMFLHSFIVGLQTVHIEVQTKFVESGVDALRHTHCVLKNATRKECGALGK